MHAVKENYSIHVVFISSLATFQPQKQAYAAVLVDS